MKKLMTMLAAVGLSFGLFADTTFPNGTSFESNTAGDNTVELLNAKESGARWAASADASATLTVTDYIAAGQMPITAEAKRPAQFATATQNNFLEIKSAFDKPFVRTLGTALTAGDAGYYVDTLVRFTLADDTIEVSDASAKLAVYVKAIDAEGNEDGQTNLVVVANKVDAQGQKTVTHFDCVCDADVADGKWHRLTIKAIDDITNGDDVPGFVVFVDNGIVSSKTETPIASAVKDEVSVWANNKQLFCSLYPSKATITGLAVAGQGGIDDISFTQDVPFPAARDYGTLTVNFSADKAKIAEFKVTAGSVDYEATAAQIEAGSMVIPLQGELPKTIGIAWTAQPGFKSGFDTVAVDDGVATVPGGTVKGLVARFEEEYDNLKDAVDAANASVTNGTLTLLADEVEGDVIDITNKTAEITLDLNGKNIAAGSLYSIKVSTGAAGLIVTGEGVVAGAAKRMGSGKLTIENGTFNGEVTATTTVTGGKFSVASNSDEKGNCKLTAPEGKVWEKDGTETYWQLTEKKTTDITADMISEITATYGTAVTDVEVKDGGKTLIKDVDYTVAFTVEAGTYTATTPAGTEVTATVIGMGDYSNSAEKKFTVAKATATIAISGLQAEYDYQATFPEATITTDPAGLATVSTWTNSAGTAVEAPDETADTYGLFVVLNANEKNYTAEEATAAIAMKAKQTGPYTPGPGGGSVTPGEKPGEYIVAGDSSTHSVTIAGGLSDGDTIIVQDAETANIIGVPASQIKVVLGSVEVDKTAFIGGDKTGYSLELNPEVVTPEISDVEETADLDIAAGKIACSGIKGLFYSLVKSDEVAAVKTQEKCIANAQCQETGTAVKLQDMTEKGAKAFYLIKVGKAPMTLED